MTTGNDLHAAASVRIPLSPEGALMTIELVHLVQAKTPIVQNIMRSRLRKNRTLSEEEQLPTFLCTDPDQLTLTETSPWDFYYIPACLLTYEEIESLYMVYDQISLHEGMILSMTEAYYPQGIEFLNGIYKSQFFTWSNTNLTTFIPIKHKIPMHFRNCFIIPE